MTTTIRSAVINARITPEDAAELRHRAERNETTVSRVVAGIVHRALRADQRSTASGDAG